MAKPKKEDETLFQGMTGFFSQPEPDMSDFLPVTEAEVKNRRPITFNLNSQLTDYVEHCHMIYNKSMTDYINSVIEDDLAFLVQDAPGNDLPEKWEAWKAANLNKGWGRLGRKN